MYCEHLPSIALRPFVETYWVSEGFIDSQEFLRVLPDGCVDIIVSTYCTGDMEAYRPYLVGTITTYLTVPLLGIVRMMGIRFKPGGITAFTRIPVQEFTDTRVDISLTETLFDRRFYEELQAKDTSTEACLLYIDHYLTGKLTVLLPTDRRVMGAVRLITDTYGKVPIKQLLDHVCLSQRQFERRFKASIGISPKVFSRITRFNHTRRQLKAQPRQSLSDTAFDCGYYDHAHLTKEFYLFSGNSPVDYTLSKAQD